MVEGSHPLTANTKVATTRAPHFAEGTYRDPLYGFRELGPYVRLPSTDPSPEFNDAADIPAASGFGPGATEFFETWSAMSVIPRSHFFLIFIVGDMPLPPSLLCPSDFDIPFESFDLLPDFTGLEAPSFLVPDSSSSSVSSSPTRSPRSRPRSLSPYATSQRPESSKASAVCTLGREKISDFENLQSKAKWCRGTKATPLASLGCCYYAVERILVLLGFNVKNPNFSLSVPLDGPNDIRITTKDVLEVWGWSVSTFDKKRKLYKAAKSVACREWKGSTTEATNTADSELYDKYLGLKFLWAENGPFTNLDSPLPSLEALGAEKHAASLKQTDLDDCKLLFDKYTKEVS
ncbi:hypothetical protein C8R45DRAFT_1100489 [Mycena sanguinolenta]|nr:hypothetical protein C8R45DRAFT_1100489 [Mycena sanguinolenta]